MKSIQALRVDSTKQQLLESRMTSTSPTNNLLNTTSDSNSINTETKLLFQKSEVPINQSSSETNEFNNINTSYDLISENIKIDDNSSSSACLINNANNSMINVITETCSVQNNIPKPIYIYSQNNTAEVVNEAHSSPNRQISISKRRRKTKIESPNSKKLCKLSCFFTFFFLTIC